MTRILLLSLLLPLYAPAQVQQLFTREELIQVRDTVWQAVNHRRALAYYRAEVDKLEQLLASAEAREAAERSRGDSLAAIVGDAVTGRDRAIMDASIDVARADRKGRGKFWLGFILGNITGAGTGYTIRDMKP
jgi:hypothetical protein